MRRCLAVGIFKHFFFCLFQLIVLVSEPASSQFGSASLLLSRQLFLATICQRPRT